MIDLINVAKGYPTKQGWHWVLNDVTLHLPKRNIGILGLNGAGKSTLVRLLCGVEPPTRGKIVRHLRLSWPLGFSGGFQGSLTGRENAEFIARIYGAEPGPFVAFAREFSELGKFFDVPISKYSSGMRSRFAFAVSFAADFECYLIDEVTAVGDQRFKNKYREAFEERKARANLIMVSHSPATIRKDCDMGAVLHAGNILLFEDVEEAISEYIRLNDLPRAMADKPGSKAAVPLPTKPEPVKAKEQKGKEPPQGTETPKPKLTPEEQEARRAARREAQAARAPARQAAEPNEQKGNAPPTEKPQAKLTPEEREARREARRRARQDARQAERKAARPSKQPKPGDSPGTKKQAPPQANQATVSITADETSATPTTSVDTEQKVQPK